MTNHQPYQKKSQQNDIDKFPERLLPIHVAVNDICNYKIG